MRDGVLVILDFKGKVSSDLFSRVSLVTFVMPALVPFSKHLKNFEGDRKQNMVGRPFPK